MNSFSKEKSESIKSDRAKNDLDSFITANKNEDPASNRSNDGESEREKQVVLNIAEGTQNPQGVP